MDSYENMVYTAKIENGTVREFFRKKDPWNLLDAAGVTGAIVYTLKNEDIFLNPPPCSPYIEHLSAFDPIAASAVSFELDALGLHIKAKTENTEVSQFGIRVDGNLVSHPGTPFEHQFLPCSPYSACNGKVCYCIFTSPDGRYLIVLSEGECDGWKMHYSSEGFGHIIEGFSMLASFDYRYNGSGKREISILLTVTDTLDQAFKTIGDFYQLPYVRPLLSGSFGNGAVVTASEGVQALELKCLNTNEYFTMDILSPVVKIPMKTFGFYEVTPIADGKRGIPAIVWNGVNFDDCFFKAENAICEPYHVDHNLCEGGCWTWSLLKYAQQYGEKIMEHELLKDLDVIMGKVQPYIPRRSIVPFKQEKYAPVHLFQSNRIQEQFYGVSILLDAFKVYKKNEYLDYAILALDELIQNWIMPDGEVKREDVDYTTVTCPVITVVDMAMALKDKRHELSERYSAVAVKIADHVVSRGFSFPTEGEQNLSEMEDGSISCSALTVLYVYYYLCQKPEYLSFAQKVLTIHNAWRMNSPDAHMYGSSLRWWETIWEGDGTGPNICAGHAWTIWRSEALFYLGLLTGNEEALLDSWNGFLSNFAKEDENGNMYSCFVPDFICGEGIDLIREKLLTKESILPLERHRIVHDYPKTPDRSLSRYVWIRSVNTWMKTAAVLSIQNAVLSIRCHIEDGNIVPDNGVEKIYISPLVSSQYHSKISVIALPMK